MLGEFGRWRGGEGIRNGEVEIGWSGGGEVERLGDGEIDEVIR